MSEQFEFACFLVFTFKNADVEVMGLNSVSDYLSRIINSGKERFGRSAFSQLFLDPLTTT